MKDGINKKSKCQKIGTVVDIQNRTLNFWKF